MSNDNQTQLAREASEEIVTFILEDYADRETVKNRGELTEYVTAIILRKLNGSDEYRRGVERCIERVKTTGNSSLWNCDGYDQALSGLLEDLRALLTTDQGVSGRGEGGDVDMLERMEAECDLRLQVRMDNLMEQGYSENHARIIAEQEDKPTIQQ